MEEMAQYDDKRDLTDYNFQKDGMRARNPNSDDKRKASYRFRYQIENSSQPTEKSENFTNPRNSHPNMKRK